MSNIIKVAVVGTGSIGGRYLSILKKMNGVEPIAVPKREARLDELEDQGFQVARDIPSAVQKGATHCIVASSTGLHIGDGLEALKYDLHLFVEKPLGVDARSCTHFMKTAKKKGQKIDIGCVLRFSDSLNTFRKLLDKIGFVHTVRIACRSYLPDWRLGSDYRRSYSASAAEGGVLRDLIHEIDYATWIFGWPESIRADLKNTNQLGIEAEESAELSWKNKNGTSLFVSLDYLSKIPTRTMEAVGEKGSLEWNGIKEAVTLERMGEPAEIIASQEGVDEKYVKELRSFLEPTTDFEMATGIDALRALSLCDAARLSSQNRQEETIRYLI